MRFPGGSAVTPYGVEPREPSVSQGQDWRTPTDHLWSDNLLWVWRRII